MNSLSNNTNNLSFKAVPLRKTQVLRRVAEDINKLVSEEVRFAEVQETNPIDKAAIDSLKHVWSDGRFTEVICLNTNLPNRHKYVLTTQKDNCERINPEKVIALADCDLEDSRLHLRFIQSKYDKYQYAGQAMLESIVENAKNIGAKTMEVFVEERIKPFYRKVFPSIENKPCTQESSTNMILRFPE